MDSISIRKKILIADDDDMLAGIYSAVFKEHSFEVMRAHDGKEAWEMLEKGFTPDVILTGIVMPEMSGFDLVVKMRADARFERVPVAIISHRGLLEDERKAREMGIGEFMVQSRTTPGEVVRRVRLLLGDQNKFKIAFLGERYDGQAFINFMNKQQFTSCSTQHAKEAELELEAGAEKGTFTVRLIC